MTAFMKLNDLKGLGPKRLALLEEKNIRTADDLLHFLPVSYLDNSVITPVEDLQDGDFSSVRLKVTTGPSFFSRRGLNIISFFGVDEKGKKVAIRWFNQPYRSAAVIIGKSYIFCGKISKKTGKPLSFINPSVSTDLKGIIPVYQRINGIPNSLIRTWLNTIIQDAYITETLPEFIVSKYSLMPLNLAVTSVHFPQDKKLLEQAYYRIRFEKALLYFLFLGLKRKEDIISCGYAFDTSNLAAAYEASLPYELTSGQKNSIMEICADMAKNVPMNRLLQGDVGCGKTVVAEFAVFVADYNKKQSAFMAPTELLAIQQYKNLKKRFGERCGLYTGSLDSSSRREALFNIKTKKWTVIVGTHALFSEDVHFCDLGLVITDEQHRFGVEQRARLIQKGNHPDVLVMSATPIPRTLALMLYGDLDVSVIHDMPEGRKKINTYIVGTDKRTEMYKFLGKESSEGRRCYVVCPLIESDDDSRMLSVYTVAEELKGLLPDNSIRILHGRMKEPEKAEAMQSFLSGETQILVSTTVIEVGIHVPEAVHIVIENADSFGLSTLHQLRGRVGRGSTQGNCYLSVSNPESKGLERLNIFKSVSDGFSIAEKDMEMRGAGDILGVQQSGAGDQISFMKECGYTVLERAKEASDDIFCNMTSECLSIVETAEKKYGKSNIAFN